MKDEVRKFLKETFGEIQDYFRDGDYEDGECAYSVNGGVLEIAICRDVLEPIEDEVRYILSNKLLSLFGDDFEGEVDENDYFEFDWRSDYFHPDSITFYEEIGYCFEVYYIIVKAKIEKLEELFNKN